MKRVFLVTNQEVESDPETENILMAHGRVMTTKNSGHREGMDSPVVQSGYHAACLELSEIERDQMLRVGKHFGLLLSQDKALLLVPIYRSDNRIAASQFRAGIAPIEYQSMFKEIMGRSTPLDDFLEDKYPSTDLNLQRNATPQTNAQPSSNT